MEGYMATAAVSKLRLALGLEAYGLKLRLWKEPAEREWAATLRDDVTLIDCRFEEDNLTMAKLRVLGEARKRAMSRSEGETLPACDSLLDSWKPVKMTNS
jgi:hypothetical protein